MKKLLSLIILASTIFSFFIYSSKSYATHSPADQEMAVRFAHNNGSTNWQVAYWYLYTYYKSGRAHTGHTVIKFLLTNYESNEYIPAVNKTFDRASSLVWGPRFESYQNVHPDYYVQWGTTCIDPKNGPKAQFLNDTGTYKSLLFIEDVTLKNNSRANNSGRTVYYAYGNTISGRTDQCPFFGPPPPPPCSCGGWNDRFCGGGSCAQNRRLQTRNCNRSSCGESRCVQDNACECNCGDWNKRTCGGGSCGPNKRQFTRNCNPNGCRDESECRDDISCTKGSIGGTVYIDGKVNGKENNQFDKGEGYDDPEVQRGNISGGNFTVRERKNPNPNYSFGGLTGGTEHDIRITDWPSARLNLESTSPRRDVRVPNNNVDFRFNFKKWRVFGTVFWDPDGTPDSGDEVRYANQGSTPGKVVRVCVVGQGCDDTDPSGANRGDYSVGGVPTNLAEDGAKYTVRVTEFRTTHEVNNNNQTVNIRANNERVNFYISPPGYDISGTIYVDDGDGVLDPGAGANRDQPYTLSYGGQIASVTVDGTRSDNVDRSGRYSIGGNSNGNNRSVRLNVNTLRPAYRNIVSPPGNPRVIAVNGADRTNINFLIARTPPSTWSLSGGLFIDTDPTRQRNGEPYTTPLNPEHIEINGRRLNNGSFPGSTFDAAGFYVPDLAAGVYDVTFPVPIRQNFAVSYHPGSYRVTLGAAPICPPPSTCNTDGDAENIDFGISDNPTPQSWIQSQGGDFRFDRNSYVNVIPIAGGGNICGNTTRPYVSSNSVVNANLSSGIVFTGTNPQFAENGDQPSKAAPNRWLLTGNAFTPARPNTIRTSYAYIKAAMDKAKIATNPMIGPPATSPNKACTQGGGPNCTFRPAGELSSISSGAFTHTGTVTLPSQGAGGTYTFPGGNDFVFLINGSLNINTNIDVPTNSTVTFIVSGDITVANSVNQIEGIFSANGNFTFVSGATTTPLVVEGSVIANAGYSSGEINTDRDLGAGNSTCPAVRVISRPDFILNGPELMRFPISIISEVAPQGGN